MGDNFNKDLGITAAIGCGTGFLWSALSGRAKLSKKRGLLQAFTGCVGSALNATTIYTVSRKFTKDVQFARRITGVWFGVQSAASFTHRLGTQFGWQKSTAYNLISIPLNFASAPIISTASLLWGGIGVASNGFKGGVSVFGGSLLFHHKKCFGNGAMQIGMVGHYCRKETKDDTKFHELGHLAQSSIMGDIGIIGVNLLNSLGQLVVNQRIKENDWIVDTWADDYGEVAKNKFEEANKTKGSQTPRTSRRVNDR